MEKLQETSPINQGVIVKMPGVREFLFYQIHVVVVFSIIAAIIIFVINWFHHLAVQWIAFLTGILVSATLASLTCKKLVIQIKAQLAAVKKELEHQIQYCKITEEKLLANQPLLNMIDEVNSLMVAFVDTEGRYQYHNHAFREWLNLRPERINGRRMREVLGSKSYEEIAASVRQALGGHAIHFDQKVKLPNGSYVTVSIDHIPQRADDGKVNGFYILATVMTENRNTSLDLAPPSGEPANRIKREESAKAAVPAIDTREDIYADTFSEEICRHQDEGFQLLAAIEKGEFSLFCQRIIPLAQDAVKVEYYEILIRLFEEEINMMPPGAFFPLAEKHGLMPYLDRWVLRQVIEFIAQKKPSEHPENKYFINMSLATLVDPGFHEFLRLILLEYDVRGHFLCFELPFCDLTFRAGDLTEFSQQAKVCGCSIALSSFGREPVQFEQIHGIPVDFIKIDGSVIHDIVDDLVKLAKVISINRVSKKVGIKTIAELVESNMVIEKLREIGVDFAQGFEISHPLPLADIK